MRVLLTVRPGSTSSADKLHLWVEAPSQMELTKAKGEIKRIVDDIMLHLAQTGKLDEQQTGAGQGGRYSVV
eukprot:COSAG01_NODE_418_length_17279_cov_69.506228_9_plen_71_part_00